VCLKVELTSYRQHNNTQFFLTQQLAALKALDISGQNITSQGADLVAAILHQTTSLEVLDISYTNLTTANWIKIREALKYVTTLRCLKMRNAVRNDAPGHIAEAVCSNCGIEKLDIFDNQLSSKAMTKTVGESSKIETIEVLDISKSRVNMNSIGNLSAVLSKCLVLQELDLSQNSLKFTSVLRVVKALRNYPYLKRLTLEKNHSSLLSECEFLADLILSTNKSLLYLNVCGRNIRPRFVENYMTLPYSKEEHNNFVNQNLYWPGLLLKYVSRSVHNPKEAANAVQDTGNVITCTELCPIAGEDISSYHTDHYGGTFYNAAHDFAIIIPPGSVLQGDCVQIQANGSRFGPYQLPDGYHPISSFFWVSAHYTFRTPVYLILSHHASPRSVKDLSSLCALEACALNVCTTSEGKLLMNELLDGVFFDDKIQYCVISTNHFCSYCLAKNDVYIPDKFVASYFRYECRRIIKAEVCMCHANRECLKVS